MCLLRFNNFLCAHKICPQDPLHLCTFIILICRPFSKSFNSSIFKFPLIYGTNMALDVFTQLRPTCSVIKTPISEASDNSQRGRWRHGGKLSLDVLSLQDEIHILSASAHSSVALKNPSHIVWIIHVVLHFTGTLYQVIAYIRSQMRCSLLSNRLLSKSCKGKCKVIL